MVDRVEKVDPSLYRVQETDRDRGRRHQEEEQQPGKKKEKDKFDKGGPFWKKLVPDTTGKPLAEKRTLWGEGGVRPQEGPVTARIEGEEPSLSLSQRVLVLWGILDFRGRPRVPVIVSYGVVILVITLATFLIMGILWR